MITQIPFRYNDAGSSIWEDPELSIQPNDCAVRAIAIALDQCYRDVWNELDSLMEIGRNPDDGVSHYAIRVYLKDHGWICKYKNRLNLKGLVEIFGPQPESTIFRVRIRGQNHLSVLKSGEIHDKIEWWHEIDPKMIQITDIFVHPNLS